jgi:hypothetical protein
LPNQCYLAGLMLPQMQLSGDEEGYQANVVSCQNYVKKIADLSTLKNEPTSSPQKRKTNKLNNNFKCPCHYRIVRL